MRTFLTIIACLGLLLVFLASAPASLTTQEFLRHPAAFGHQLGPLFGMEYLYFWGWYPAAFGALLALVGGLITRPRWLWIPLVSIGLLHILSFAGEYVYIVREAGKLVRHPVLRMAQTVAPGLVCIVEGLVLRSVGRRAQV